MEEVGVNIIIESEGDVFVGSSPDINVFVEGSTIDEVKKKFSDAVVHHLETFPEERQVLGKKEKFEMPMIQRIFI